jgi:hypothetical protein
VRVYIGQARNAKMIEKLTAHGFGECTVRGELPPRRTPWFYDNGAFRDFTAGKPFSVAKYERDLERLPAMPTPPAFLVVPDVVAGGVESLEVSLAWLPRLRGLAPLFLAVQDGMSLDDVARVIEGFDGVFVGGSVPWKVRTGAAWVRFAHGLSKPCHIGRVGTIRRLRWARLIGADSIDSCFPLWTKARLARFADEIARPQGEFFEVTP